MALAEQSVSYTAEVSVSGRAQAAATMREWRNGTRRRVEYLSPSIRRGDLVVADGNAVYTYHRAENSAVQTRMDGGRINWPRLEKQFKVATLGEDRVAGRAAWMVGLHALNDGHLVRKLWIDEGNFTRLRVERFGRLGRTLEDIALTDVHFASVDNEEFVWHAPPGAKLETSAGINYATLDAAHQAAPWMQFPHDPPSDYAFESAVIGGGRIWLRYSNGLSRFSLFQEQASGEADAPAQAHGDSWFWRRAGYRFLLVGLPQEQAAAVIESVR